MKRRNLLAGTSVALGAMFLHGARHNANAASTATMTSSMVQASGHQPRGWLRQVNLTPAQAAEIQKIDQKFSASLMAHKRAVKRETTALRSLKQHTKADTAQLKAQTKRQARAIQTYEAVLGAKCFARSEVLTAQQRRQVTHFLAKRPDHSSYVAAILAA